MCQKLWKLDDSKQSYCKNYLAYFFWSIPCIFPVLAATLTFPSSIIVSVACAKLLRARRGRNVFAVGILILSVIFLEADICTTGLTTILLFPAVGRYRNSLETLSSSYSYGRQTIICSWNFDNVCNSLLVITISGLAAILLFPVVYHCATMIENFAFSAWITIIYTHKASQLY